MNVYYTNPDPVKAAHELSLASLHKVLVDYPRLLSCAHRALDGFGPLWVKENGNDRKWWLHETDTVDDSGKKVKLTGYVLLGSMPSEHPVLKWVCESSENYGWVYKSWVAAMDVYETFEKTEHEYSRLLAMLGGLPENIPEKGFTPLKFVYPEYRHIQPAEKAYQVQLSYLAERLNHDSHVFPMGKPSWLGVKAEKSETQKNREERTGKDEGIPTPRIPGKKLETPTPKPSPAPAPKPSPTPAPRPSPGGFKVPSPKGLRVPGGKK